MFGVLLAALFAAQAPAALAAKAPVGCEWRPAAAPSPADLFCNTDAGVQKADHGTALNEETVAKAEAGDSKAMGALAVFYDNRSAKDVSSVPLALDWAQRAEKAGDGPGTSTLAELYADGKGLQHNEKEALRLYEKAGQRGYAFAYLLVGIRLSDGHGVTANPQEAVRFLRLGVAAGVTPAAFILGDILTGGHGLPPDPDQAKQMYKLAAVGGLPPAMTRYCQMLAKDDPVEAAAWCKKATDFKDIEGYNFYGRMLMNGVGMPKNPVEGAAFIKRASDLGYREAQSAMGVIYTMGNGVDKNEVEGLRLLRLAAEHGSIEGMFNYGVSLIEGRGTPKNLDEGLKWVRQSATKNYPNAVSYLKKLGQ
jgi:TPR repeat protein